MKIRKFWANHDHLYIYIYSRMSYILSYVSHTRATRSAKRFEISANKRRVIKSHSLIEKINIKADFNVILDQVLIHIYI